eukprot:TRINITY_DN8114_c0_g1_i2.p1 TRINITY_DN8114_c0_g1~~TRINITY_DN8114_c0_g1_i2.p1  ORF type:complete len:246 (-),score=31.96 TRINITY_DN8114_c0_g1_i2:244-981(-)
MIVFQAAHPFPFIFKRFLCSLICITMNFRTFLLVAVACTATFNTARADVLCEDCQQLVQALIKFLTNSEVQEMITQQLDEKVCSKFGEDLQQTCSEYVQALIPSVFEYVEEEVSPEQVCTTATLCPGTPSADLVTNVMAFYIKKAHANVDVSKLSDDNAYCEYCELVVGELHELIANEEIQQQIKQALGSLCTVLPFDAEECSEMVNMYADQVFSMLAGYLVPDMLCPQFGFCPAPSFKIQMQVE